LALSRGLARFESGIAQTQLASSSPESCGLSIIVATPTPSWDVDEARQRGRRGPHTRYPFDEDGLVARGDGVELVTGVRSSGPAHADHLVRAKSRKGVKCGVDSRTVCELAYCAHFLGLRVEGSCTEDVVAQGSCRRRRTKRLGSPSVLDSDERRAQSGQCEKTSHSECSAAVPHIQNCTVPAASC